MSRRTNISGGTTTTVLARPMVCHKCTAPHFTYQLTCKRCGTYLSKDDMVVPGDNRILTIIATIAIAAVAFAAGKCLHLI